MSDEPSIRDRVSRTEGAWANAAQGTLASRGGCGPGPHILQECEPAFLFMLDNDPDAAWCAFHDFAWRLLRAYPPPVFRDLPLEAREDLIADLVLRCRKDDFRVLRRYRNQGLPFAFWLARMAQNRAIDHCRKSGRPAPPTPRRTNHGSEERIDQRDLLEVIDSCMSEMSDESRLLLECVADGLKPRQIAALLGLPPTAGKKISDKIRACRRELKRRLARRGCGLEVPT